MLKTMFVLVVISGQYYPAPVVISQHSTLEKCEQAFKGFTAGIARDTNTPGNCSPTPFRLGARGRVARVWIM
jgi:hypothetical protein